MTKIGHWSSPPFLYRATLVPEPPFARKTFPAESIPREPTGLSDQPSARMPSVRRIVLVVSSHNSTVLWTRLQIQTALGSVGSKSIPAGSPKPLPKVAPAIPLLNGGVKTWTRLLRESAT